jgi:hypothetical protein
LKSETTLNPIQTMNARNGKIARLPREIREQLNPRLERSEQSPTLLAWLNGLKEVKELLQDEFDAAPITKQNLSEWRKGGFQEWLDRCDLFAEYRKVEDFAQEVGEDRHDVPADAVATFLAVRHAALISRWDGEVDHKFEARVRVLDRLSRSVVRIQRSTRQAKRENDEYIHSLEEEEQRVKEYCKKKLLDQVWGLRRELELAPAFGGGELGRKIAKYIVQLENDVPGAKLDLTGDEKPDPKLVPPTPKVRTAKRTRKSRAKREDKALDTNEMEVEEVEKSSPVESEPVQPGKASLEQLNEEELGAGLGLGTDE